MDFLKLNIFNVIILVGIIHGVIFSLILLMNRKLKSKTNFFLSLTILSLALSNLQYWLIDVDLYSIGPKFIFIPFEFLMLPFFYFFVKSYLGKKILLIEYSSLLFLFFLIIFYQLVFTIESFSLKLINLVNLIIEYISIFYALILIFIVFKTLINYERESESSNTLKIETEWLKRILFIGFILCLLWILSLNFFSSIKNGYYRFYPLWIGISILIYWVGYVSIFKTTIYNDRYKIRNKNQRNLKRNYAISTQANLFAHLENHVIEQKLYLDPTLDLKMLSKNLNLSEGYVSLLINKYSALNFNAYINSLRINEAKEMLKNPEFKNYTITSIGLEAGFNSKASFYRVFKKATNKSPSEYLKDVSNL